MDVGLLILGVHFGVHFGGGGRVVEGAVCRVLSRCGGMASKGLLILEVPEGAGGCRNGSRRGALVFIERRLC